MTKQSPAQLVATTENQLGTLLAKMGTTLRLPRRAELLSGPYRGYKVDVELVTFHHRQILFLCMVRSRDDTRQLNSMNETRMYRPIGHIRFLK